MTLEQRITALAQAVGADIKALYETIMNPNFRQYQHQLFTSSGTWTVPAGVNMIWVDAVGGGDGGAGGFASAESGGGGAGGQGMIPFVMYRFPVVPGESLSISVGDGGVGGAVGARGGLGGTSRILGSIHRLSTVTSGSIGPGAAPGTATLGGAANAIQSIYAPFYTGETIRAAGGTNAIKSSASGSGGAPATAGSAAGGAQLNGEPQWYKAGGNAVGNLGGGGTGAGNIYGVGGKGGNGGQAGEDAPTMYNGLPSYGGSGGGGGCNAPGGNGAPGMVRIYWLG